MLHPWNLHTLSRNDPEVVLPASFPKPDRCRKRKIGRVSQGSEGRGVEGFRVLERGDEEGSVVDCHFEVFGLELGARTETRGEFDVGGS